jgi:2-dehydropantoate 2-reductase
VFLAALAGSTCLMRATIGDIAASAGGSDFVLGLFDECRSVAAAAGYPMRNDVAERTRQRLAEPGSTLAASMLRDIERNSPIEADHIIGELPRRASEQGLPERDLTLARIAYAHLKAYEERRCREV